MVKFYLGKVEIGKALELAFKITMRTKRRVAKELFISRE
jgi:hypothetical protein